jgi:Mn-containing catalase
MKLYARSFYFPKRSGRNSSVGRPVGYACQFAWHAFNGSPIYASGNIAGDMFANVTAEATGHTLACRLYELTDDPRMKDMWSFLIARDTL